jgi:hypothetical protein
MAIRTSSWGGAFAALTLAVGGLFLGSTAEATPGFARQTGMACVACHFQHYPTLNSFGRAFKASGTPCVVFSPWWRGTTCPCRWT